MANKKFKTKVQIDAGLKIKDFNEKVLVVDANGDVEESVTSKQDLVKLQGAAAETGSVVYDDKAQTLTNKTIDADNNTISNLEVDNLKTGVLDEDLSDGTSAAHDTLPSAKAVKDYADSLNTDVASDIADLQSALGVSDGDTDMGDFLGSTITNGGSAKAALQELETAVDLRALDADVIKHDGSVAFTADQSMGGNKLTNLAAPSAASDAATKGYVDNALEGLKPKEAARVATTANITIASDLNVGDVIDGITLVDGDRVLVKDQSTASENGVYIAGASPARSTDFDSLSPIDEINGALVAVQEGTDNEGKVFVQSGSVSTLGSDAINFVLYNSVSSLVGADGITVSGTSISVDHDGEGLQISAGQLALELDGATLEKSASGLKLSDTAVTAAQYGSASETVTLDIDAQGRITGASEQTIAITSAEVTDFTEASQDAIGGALLDTASIDLTYDDAANTISADVLPAGVDHDQLLNFVANEHIDHSGVEIATGSDSGLTGGGDITSTRNISVDINGTTALGANAADDDEVLVYDADGSVLRKATISEVIGTRGGNVSSGDIKEASASYVGGATAAAISGFTFDQTVVRSFDAQVTVIHNSTSYETFRLQGLQKATGVWEMSVESTGDDSGISFSIASSGGNGVVQLTNADGTNGGAIKFRADTLSI